MTTTTFKNVTNYLENFAPKHFQESYDNSGLLVGEPSTSVSGILVSLDAVESVVDEAIAKNCNLIVAHHPIIFRGLKSLTGRNYIERTVIKALRNNIGIYAIHTNLDNVRQGVNQKISEKIGLTDLQILSPKPNTTHQNEEVGSGMIGHLEESMSGEAFLSILKTKMTLPLIKHTKLLGKKVRKVAVCGGAGSFLLPTAIEKGADVFVTSDYKYHEFFDAENHLTICDIGHYESEVFTKNLLLDLLKKEFSSLKIQLCDTNTNPVEYYF